jgi:hypothetical protein
MKKTTLFKGALAFAAASVIGASAHSQTISTVRGDMIFNMYATGGTGSSYDYEVDLGNFSNFLPGGIYGSGSLVSLSNVSITDIGGTGSGGGYGSLWNSDSDVFWSVVGSNSTSGSSHGVSGYAVFATDSATLDDFSSGTHSLSLNNIGGYVGDINTSGISTTANSNGEGIFDNSGNGDQYTVADGGAPNFFGGYLPTTFESSANGTSTLGLYEVLNVNNTNPATEVGTFTLSNSGLTYQAVPEPSTWATMLVGAATLLGFRRRRRNA